MSYTITVDQDTLPAAMLALAKAHLKVGDDEDVLITEYLAQAIAWLENFWQLQVFGAEVEFIPDGGLASYDSPVQPVSAFTAADADAADVSADYALQTASLTYPYRLVRVDGAVFPAGVTFSLTAGYAALADMSPAMRGAILRKTAEIYEHRGSVTTESVDQIPSWTGDILGGLWVPRA